MQLLKVSWINIFKLTFFSTFIIAWRDSVLTARFFLQILNPSLFPVFHPYPLLSFALLKKNKNYIFHLWQPHLYLQLVKFTWLSPQFAWPFLLDGIFQNLWWFSLPFSKLSLEGSHLSWSPVHKTWLCTSQDLDRYWIHRKCVSDVILIYFL